VFTIFEEFMAGLTRPQPSVLGAGYAHVTRTISAPVPPKVQYMPEAVVSQNSDAPLARHGAVRDIMSASKGNILLPI